jgi:hypothetical protein
MRKEADQEQNAGFSKVKLALGAASLFFFLVGIKRTFRTDDGRVVQSTGERSGSGAPQ